MTDGGHTVAYDGGCRGDTDNFLDTLARLSGNRRPVIDLWLVSHPHGDHYGVLLETMKRARTGFDKFPLPEVRCVAYCPMPEIIGEYEPWCADQIVEFNRAMADCPWPLRVIREGDVFTFDRLTFTCLLTPDETEKNNAFNNASCVFRVTERAPAGGDAFSMILLGDLGVEGSRRLMQKHAGDLAADAVQVSHHGQKGCTFDVYRAISPKMAFWPTPDWLWNSEGSELSTVNTRACLDALGAKVFWPLDENIVLTV